MEAAGPAADAFTPAERARLAPHFTNLDGPVFALVNLPEVVKGALFARYSRSPKSLRRLFLDEFAGPGGEPAGRRWEVRQHGSVVALSSGHEAVLRLLPCGHACNCAAAHLADEVCCRCGLCGYPCRTCHAGARAERLYERVFVEYGDDSVAQLGGVHLACEGVSNVLTKILEWGRLMAYLEQSTRYIPYTDRPGGRFRYHVPAELGTGPLARRYVETLDGAFETYVRWLEPVQAYFRARHPRQPGDSETAYRQAIRAQALDTLRGLLPAATLANVGLFGSGQAYEALLLRLRAHPLAEARRYADLILAELRKVIPAFVRRVDLEDRGVAWSRYLAETREATRAVAERLLKDVEPEPRPEVVLTDYDPDGEVKVVAAALYAVSDLPDDQLLARVRAMSPEDRLAALRAYVGVRGNRRHKPGRAFERARYRFDVLTDYAAFRDLQRHRLLTLEWQPLSPRHGFVLPAAVEEAGAGDDWRRVMEAGAALHDAMAAAGLGPAAQYPVPMAYRVRFYMEMNAREAMHVLELRTAPQGHPSYRRVCQAMHRLIAEQAGHRALAEAMRFVDHSAVELARLEAERRAEARGRRDA